MTVLSVNYTEIHSHLNYVISLRGNSLSLVDKTMPLEQYVLYQIVNNANLFLLGWVFGLFLLLPSISIQMFCYIPK